MELWGRIPDMGVVLLEGLGVRARRGGFTCTEENAEDEAKTVWTSFSSLANSSFLGVAE